MARKTKRRPYRAPRPQRRNEDQAENRHRLQMAAESLLATSTPEELDRELSRRQWLLDEADQAAQLDPSPANLSRYRFARSQYEAADAAVKLLARGAAERS